MDAIAMTTIVNQQYTEKKYNTLAFSYGCDPYTLLLGRKDDVHVISIRKASSQFKYGHDHH